MPIIVCEIQCHTWTNAYRRSLRSCLTLFTKTPNQKLTTSTLYFVKYNLCFIKYKINFDQ